MSLPAFLGRIHNAAGPLLGGLAESELAAVLDNSTLRLEINEHAAVDPGHRAGFLLAVNLAARLYPRLSIEAPGELAARAAGIALAINEGCDLGAPAGRTLTLSWCAGEPAAERVTVAADRWNLWLDHGQPNCGAAEAPAAMAAAALGLGALFRAVFAQHLTHPRMGPEPLAMNLITLQEPADTPPTPDCVTLGTLHLAGCGAVGESTAATLAQLPVTGTLYAVDDDLLDVGNLQRYVLALAADVRAAKPALISRAFEGHPLEVVEVNARWGEDERTAPGREKVLCALDTKQGRIDIQAGEHRELFNAWTQPQDIGVSRHQRFGDDPCLACLAWPRRQRPSETQLIADALGEDELRVVLYAVGGTRVGAPLPREALTGTRRLPLPTDHARWAERSVLEDLIERRGLPTDQFAPFANAGIRALYRDAVCAGMLMHYPGARDPEVSVPLAHQSALAGILLATWAFVDRVPELCALRPTATQARYDLLNGGVQVWTRPRDRTPGCLCADRDFLDGYARRWGAPTAAAA
jgi:hypothetical protein